MRLHLDLGFTDDVVIAGHTLRARVGVTRFSDVTLAAALHRGASVAHLEALGTTIPGRTLAAVLDVLHSRCMLQWRLVDEAGTTMVTAAPRRPDVPWPGDPLTEPPTGVRLSRFALLRPAIGSDWLLESGTSDWEVQLTADASAALTNEDPALLGAIGAFGMLDTVDVDPALTMWEFHDRYFASRSRVDLGGGGTYRFAGVVPAARALEQPDGVGPALPLPPVAAPTPVDFWSMVEGRRTVRDFAPDPFPLQALSDLLWHTVRVQSIREADPLDPRAYDAVFKPVPSAGATHAVNAWLVSHNVAGLDSRAWWYDGLEHALHPNPGSTPLPAGAYGAPITILLTSRHARMAWKYEAIAYSLALKDVGVLMHALQLTGTALGLGVVPLGSGPVAAVAAALGVDRLVHAPVGELVVGLPAVQ